MILDSAMVSQIQYQKHKSHTHTHTHTLSLSHTHTHTHTHDKLGFSGGSDGNGYFCNAGDPSLFPGSENLLEKRMAIHSSTPKEKKKEQKDKLDYIKIKNLCVINSTKKMTRKLTE